MTHKNPHETHWDFPRNEHITPPDEHLVALNKLDDHLDKRDIHRIAREGQQDAYKNGELIGTYTDQWDSILSDAGIDDPEIRSQIPDAHGIKATMNLDMPVKSDLDAIVTHVR